MRSRLAAAFSVVVSVWVVGTAFSGNGGTNASGSDDGGGSDVTSGSDVETGGSSGSGSGGSDATTDAAVGKDVAQGGVVLDRNCGNVQTDPANCGYCGHDCLGGGCTAGVCQPVVLA
jgi:hypothetical protein